MLTILAAIILFGDNGDSGGDAGWKIAATGLWLRFVIEFKKNTLQLISNSSTVALQVLPGHSKV